MKEITPYKSEFLEEKESQTLSNHPPKGMNPPSEYNLDFCIYLVRTMMQHVEVNRMDRSNLATTLTHSLRSILGFLEVEKMNGRK